MILEEHFDADEILRTSTNGMSKKVPPEEEEMRELNFGNVHDENAISGTWRRS